MGCQDRICLISQTLIMMIIIKMLKYKVKIIYTTEYSQWQRLVGVITYWW